jgi:hypothetical protein
VAPTRLQTRTAIADVRAGALPLPPHKATPWPADVRYTELLGGRTAHVSEWRFDGPVHQTQAQWRDPVVYLQGETRNEMMAQLLLSIHRSIRFTPAPPP